VIGFAPRLQGLAAAALSPPRRRATSNRARVMSSNSRAYVGSSDCDSRAPAAPSPAAPLLQPVQSRRALICTFLALLELVRLQAILLRQDTVFGEILIKKHDDFENVVRDAASVRDDWN